MRRQARRHERKYRRTRLPSDRLTWVQFVRYMHRKYREKGTYLEDRISSHAKGPKRLWTTFNALLGRRRGSAGHSLEESSFTADDFLASYTAKILGVRRATENAPAPHHPTTDCCLPTVNEVTTEEVRRLIITSPPKSCELDPAPTFFTPGAPGCLAASPYDAVQQINLGWSPTTVTEAIHLDSSAEGRRLGRG